MMLYLQPRMIAIFFLGFASGLPLFLTESTLSVWLKQEGVSIATIGLFALVGLPYTLKFLWSPLIDQLKVPFLTAWLGRRRSWLVFTQAALACALIALGASNPAESTWTIASLALAVAFLSASQDIVIDAFRVEMLDERTYAAGAAVVVAGYRLGMLTSGAGALYLATFLGWHTTYIIMACLLVVGMVAGLLCKEPIAPAPHRHDWLYHTVIEPFVDFAKRPYWVVALLIALFYKLGDAFAAKLAGPFYLDIGFSMIEIANITKLFGVVASVGGGLLGGYVVSRYGLMRALVLCGIAQLLSNFFFSLQALVGYNLTFLTFTIGIENITGGMGTAVFIGFLSSLCNKQFTATQFALLSSLSAVGRTLLTASSGFLAEQVGWPIYFALTAVMAIPGVLLAWWLMRKQESDDRPSL